MIADSGAAWVRLNFRLGPRFKDWTETTSLSFSALSRYDAIVQNALSCRLNVLGLLCNEAWDWSIDHNLWRANAAEVGQGNGDNDYIRGLAEHAVSLLVRHFAGKIRHWQIWNEPNCTLSCVYPSNFAWLLRRAYVAARESGVSGLTIISGALLSTHGMSATSLTPENTGATYLSDTYQQGKANAGWDELKARYGTYPLDAVGQNLYIDQWSRTSAARIELAVSLVRDACLAEEGSRRPKPIHLTEIGWTNANVDESLQAANLKIAYLKLKSLEYTPVTYWFFLRDEAAPYLYHGLLRPDGSQKPAWAAFREINEIHIYPPLQ
jgi:hypothetical protein